MSKFFSSQNEIKTNFLPSLPNNGISCSDEGQINQPKLKCEIPNRHEDIAWWKPRTTDVSKILK